MSDIRLHYELSFEGYEFDSVRVCPIPQYDVVDFFFLKDGKLLKKMERVDGMRWERYKKTPSVLFNELT